MFTNHAGLAHFRGHDYFFYHTGPLVAQCAVPRTGGWEQFTECRAPIDQLPHGTHDLFLVFHGLKGQRLMTVDCWQIK